MSLPHPLIGDGCSLGTVESHCATRRCRTPDGTASWDAVPQRPDWKSLRSEKPSGQFLQQRKEFTGGSSLTRIPCYMRTRINRDELQAEPLLTIEWGDPGDNPTNFFPKHEEMERVAWGRKEIRMRVKASCRLVFGMNHWFVPATIERLNGVIPPKFFNSPGQRFSAGAEDVSTSKNPGSVKRRCIRGLWRVGASREA